MSDPLSAIVSLLQPRARFSKVVHGVGSWRVHREDSGNPFYCVVLDGLCRFEAEGEAAISLTAGDFVLVPASHQFTVSSASPYELAWDQFSEPKAVSPNTFVLGDESDESNAHLLVGHCEFASPDSAILVTLLPKVIHISEASRLTALVSLVIDESKEDRPGREAILSRLVETMMIEAIRMNMEAPTVPGLLAGLGDEKLAMAIRKIHQAINHSWTMESLAKEAAMSRSAFFLRFSRTVGCTPMEYLIKWRMAMAKSLLREEQFTMSEIADKIGYKSASAFSTAFTHYVGLPPSKFVSDFMN